MQHKTPTRFARRMANRLGRVVRKVHRKENTRLGDHGVEHLIREAAAGQFAHFTRALVQRANAEEATMHGRRKTLREHMLGVKALRAAMSDDEKRELFALLGSLNPKPRSNPRNSARSK